MSRLPDPTRSRAVLIGCAHYRHLDDLPAVTANLTAVRDVLTAPATGGFTPGNCTVIPDPAGTGELASTLVEAARTTQDTLLVYYAGHGVLDNRNNLHLALTCTSTDQAVVPVTALPYEQVREYLKDSPASNRVVILDCCYAGRAIQDQGGTTLADRTVINGAYVLTASAAEKTALAPVGAQHTAFTGALLNLLRQGIPDGPDLLTLEILYPHLRHALVGSGLPEPRRQGTDTVTDLALTRNPGHRQATHAVSPAPPAQPSDRPFPLAFDATTDRTARDVDHTPPVRTTPPPRAAVNAGLPAAFADPAPERNPRQPAPTSGFAPPDRLQQPTDANRPATPRIRRWPRITLGASATALGLLLEVVGVAQQVVLVDVLGLIPVAAGTVIAVKRPAAHKSSSQQSPSGSAPRRRRAATATPVLGSIAAWRRTLFTFAGTVPLSLGIGVLTGHPV